MRLLSILSLAALLPTSTYAYDFSAEHNGVTIYYTLIGTGLVGVAPAPEGYKCTEITIPSTVTNDGIEYEVHCIGANAFQKCIDLISVSIPPTVTEIGDSAFEGCSGITSLSLPEKMIEIGEKAFANCTGITSLSIPKDWTSIGNEIFSGCSGITSLYLPEELTSIGNYTFSGCSALTSLTLPESLTAIGEGAFGGCSSLSSLSLPRKLTNLGKYSFQYCESLTSLSLPNSLSTIESGTFYNDISLKSLSIPNSITQIGYLAFDKIDLETIYCYSTTPPQIWPDGRRNRTFSPSIYEGCILYVPMESIEAYRASDWNNFKNIVGLNLSEIESTEIGNDVSISVKDNIITIAGVQDAIVEVYNLNGITIYQGHDTVIGNLPKGVYVVRAGNHIQKVLL